jgi:hypothetical protein
MDLSYAEAGPRAFKPGTTEADFHGCERYAVKARPYPLLQPLHVRSLSTWPTPPSTAPPSPAFHPRDTDADRLLDRQRWLTQGGNPWDTALLPEHVEAFRAHLCEYRADADRLATAATATGRGNIAHLKRQSSHLLSIEQTMLRPGAQGSCFEITPTAMSETSRLPVTPDLLYNVPHIVAAAADLHFPDQEAIYELTIGGASLGNPGMPLTTHICRNHQGSAKHWHTVTDQLRAWIVAGELRGPNPAAADDTRYDGFASPPSIPAIAVPINGTESRLKEHDYLLKRAGLPFQPKIRPTFDLSSPHDLECSPNDLCFIDPSTQTPWTTADQVADEVLTLSAACPDLNPLRGFKVDLHAAYRQLHAKRTERSLATTDLLAFFGQRRHARPMVRRHAYDVGRKTCRNPLSPGRYFAGRPLYPETTSNRLDGHYLLAYNLQVDHLTPRGRLPRRATFTSHRERFLR